MDHSQMEREIERRSRELARTLYQDWLKSLAPAEAEGAVVDAEGQERTRKRTHERELETVFGTVTVERTGYGAEGQDSLHPLDAQLNLPAERYSLQVRRRVALEAAKNSFEEAGETLARYTGAHVPKRQLEELVKRAAIDFDDFYEVRRQEGKGVPAPGPPSLMVITADSKGIMMHKQDLREATRKAAEKKKRSTLRTRLSWGEKRHRKRMATVASVYAVGRYVRTPEQMYRTLARLHDALDRDIDAANLAYDQYLAAGMPIASAVVEGACRHLIKDRMELTGARWRLTGAEAVLRLRALRSSNDFDEYWRFHEAREYERNHCARYAEEEVPAVADSNTSRLKLIEYPRPVSQRP